MSLDINFKYFLYFEFLVVFVFIYFKMVIVCFKYECVFRKFSYRFKNNYYEIRVYFFINYLLSLILMSILRLEIKRKENLSNNRMEFIMVYFRYYFCF